MKLEEPDVLVGTAPLTKEQQATLLQAMQEHQRIIEAYQQQLREGPRKQFIGEAIVVGFTAEQAAFLMAWCWRDGVR